MSDVFREGLFTGKTGLFTGGTSGIGFAIAGRFAGLGATVILNGRNPGKLDAAVKTIRDRGHAADGFANRRTSDPRSRPPARAMAK